MIPNGHRHCRPVQSRRGPAGEDSRLQWRKVTYHHGLDETRERCHSNFAKFFPDSLQGALIPIRLAWIHRSWRGFEAVPKRQLLLTRVWGDSETGRAVPPARCRRADHSTSRCRTGVPYYRQPDGCRPCVYYCMFLFATYSSYMPSRILPLDTPYIRKAMSFPPDSTPPSYHPSISVLGKARPDYQMAW
jgi:hypothetical protein